MRHRAGGSSRTTESAESPPPFGDVLNLVYLTRLCAFHPDTDTKEDTFNEASQDLTRDPNDPRHRQL